MKMIERGVTVEVVTMMAALILGRGVVVHAQTEAVSLQETELQPVASEVLPQSGTFYLLSAHGAFPSPPYPFDPYAGVLSIYALDAGRHIYLIADTLDEPAVVREAVKERTAILEAMRQETALLTAESNLMSLDGLDSGGGQMAYSYSSTELWLEFTAKTNTTGYLTAHSPADEQINGVYDLFLTTNLAVDVPGLNGTNWHWAARTDPGQTNLTVENLAAKECFFLLAKTNDTDEDGLSDAVEMLCCHSDPANPYTAGSYIPDLWEWENFGSIQPADGDYDGDGETNLEEYQNGTDPNTIQFRLLVTNHYVNATSVIGQLEIIGGVPVKMALLIDDTNLPAATWADYGASNLTVNLGLTEGWHEVRIGLRGRMELSQQSWEWNRFKLDLTPPLLIVTNPVSTTGSQPMIQLQGYCPETLASITCDLTNAAGLFTNLPIFVLDQYYDTNTWEFTTNTFQAFDLDLTNGLNTFTLHATDRAGNVDATNFSFTLISDGMAPVLNLIWPQDGMHLSGDLFTVHGLLDDPTATLTAALVDTNGATNTFKGLVERNGKFWVENLPLTGETNALILTAVDAWGNETTTNLSLIRSELGLCIGPFNPGLLCQGTLTLTGTVSDASCTVWVNGQQATVNEAGGWTATNVPVNSGGTASFYVTAYPPEEEGYQGQAASGGQTPPTGTSTNEDQPWRLYVESYQEQRDLNVHWRWDGWYEHGYHPWTESWNNYHYTRNWRDKAGGDGLDLHDQAGASHNYPTPSGTSCWSQYLWPASSWPTLVDGTSWGACDLDPPSDPHWTAPPLVPCEHCNVNDQQPLSSADWAWDGYYYYWAEYDRQDDYQRTAEAKLTLYTGGKAMPKRQSVWIISGSAHEVSDKRNLYASGGGPMIPSQNVAIGGLGNLGSDGKLYAALFDDTSIPLTPAVGGVNYYSFSVSPEKHTPYILANNMDLSTNTPTNCVGQNVTFELTFVPPLDYEDQVSRWSLPAKFVNEEYAYSDTCTSYRVNYDLLLNTNKTSCWFVNGSGGSVSIGTSLRFSNGKTCAVVAKGEIALFRPKATITFIQNPRYYTLEDWGPLCKLKLGTNDQSGQGVMFYTLNINSKYSGAANITQLVTAGYSNPLFDFSDERADGGEFYDPTAVVQVFTNGISGPLDFDDGPNSVWTTPNVVSLSCRDFVRFRPDAGGGIWVTLGIVTWNTVGIAEQDFWGNWSITTDSTPDPSGPDSSDEFPVWTRIVSGLH